MSALILALQRVGKAGVNEQSCFTGALEKERDGCDGITVSSKHNNRLSLLIIFIESILS